MRAARAVPRQHLTTKTPFDYQFDHQGTETGTCPVRVSVCTPPGQGPASGTDGWARFHSRPEKRGFENRLAFTSGHMCSNFCEVSLVSRQNSTRREVGTLYPRADIYNPAWKKASLAFSSGGTPKSENPFVSPRSAA